MVGINACTYEQWQKIESQILNFPHGGRPKSRVQFGMVLLLATRRPLLLTSEYNSLCYSPSHTISHWRKTGLSLAMNVFCTGNKHFSHWRQMPFVLEMNTLVLEMNTLVLEMNVLKMHVQISATHTHTQLATSYFQTDLSCRAHLRKQTLSCCGDPIGYLQYRRTTLPSVALNWSSRSSK